MSFEKRREIINKIQKIRNSTVITYVSSPRDNLAPEFFSMSRDDVREIINHFEPINKSCKDIDLVIVSNGGESGVSWQLVNLIRELCNGTFSVLVPYNAYSAATAIALGADKIIMTPVGHLGSVDISSGHPLNPQFMGRPIQIAEEDVAEYCKLAKDMFKITDQTSVTKVFEKLSENVHPLALGNAYRSYLKARDDVRRLLELHMDNTKEKDRIDKIIEKLVEKLYYHGHPINRQEAKSIGLNVHFAEEFQNSADGNLSKLLWELYESYEEDLKLREQYKNDVPDTDLTRVLNIKFIESKNISSQLIIEQEFNERKIKEGELTINPTSNAISVIKENGQLNVVPSEAELLLCHGKLYEKRESIGWKVVKYDTNK